MLQHLEIQDLAIIDSLSLDFPEGFTALTGETGAGKSIIVGALNLILGERASSEDVRTGCDAARVEAVFDTTGMKRVARALDEFQLAPDPANPQLVIRREISAQGRSRCLVNGITTPLWQLARIGDLLVDLHGQHQHQSLLRVELHRDILDAYGTQDIGPALANWRTLYRKYRETAARLRTLQRDERDTEREKGLLEFQIGEIHAARLQPDEDTALEEERRRLEHADALMQYAAGANEILYEGETQTPTAADLLGQSADMIDRAARLDPSLETAAKRIETLRADLEDIALTLRHYAADLENDPARLQEVNDRLHAIGRLKKKYGADIADILSAADAFEKELRGLTISDEERQQLEREIEKLEKQLAAAAENLTAHRQKTAARFGLALRRQLAELEMPNVRFEVQIAPDMAGASSPATDEEDAPPDDTPERPDFAADRTAPPAVPDHAIPFPDGSRRRIGENGADLIEFLISPNPGEDLRPLRRIASGGELSRIMLALKVILSGQDQVGTLVFDEIDTGISGRTGARIGNKMVALGDERQVICITHLPQIAAQASTHYVVRKTQEKRRTLTRVDRVGVADREREIARLLGGEPDSPLARDHARELLRTASSR